MAGPIKPKGRDYPLSATPEPKYTSKDSIDFVNLSKRANQTQNKINQMEELSNRQQDSLFNSNYFKGKAKQIGNSKVLKDKTGSYKQSKG